MENQSISPEESIFYNYIYLDPRKPGQYSYPELNISFLYEPFYVGKGKGNRKYSHLSTRNLNNNKYNQKKNNYIIEISKSYDIKKFIVQINNNLLEDEAYRIEKNIVGAIGRLDLGIGTLLNCTDGGDSFGRIWSEENKQKRSLYLRNRKDTGYNSPLKGKSAVEIYGEDYIHPKKGKTMKEIKEAKGEEYINERKGKSLTEQYGEDYINPHQGRSRSTYCNGECEVWNKGKKMKEVYGEDYVDPKKGVPKVKLKCCHCGREISNSNLKRHEATCQK